MRHHIIAILALLPILALSCAKTTPVEGGEGISRISATLAPNGSKTIIGEDGSSVLWSPADEISVFYNEDGVRFTSINTKPKATAVFTSDSPIIYGGAEGQDANMLYGLYPYSADNAQSGDKLIFTVPFTQNATAGSFAPGSFPSMGRSKDTNIAFYNVCGGIRFSITQKGIWMVKIYGNNSETLAGRVKVGFDDGGKPAVSEVLESESTVVLSAPVGGELQTGKWYYVSLLPVSLPGGFTIEFHKSASDVTKASFKSAVEIKRTTFGSLTFADSNKTPALTLSDFNEVTENWSL